MLIYSTYMNTCNIQGTMPGVRMVIVDETDLSLPVLGLISHNSASQFSSSFAQLPFRHNGRNYLFRSKVCGVIVALTSSIASTREG